ncbi:MAG: thioredoxin family protein [Promethearchaeota archaeon]
MLEKQSKKLEIEVYTSPTCPYCPAALRMLQKAVDIYGEAINVTEVSIASEEGQELATYYNVQATPTIVINSTVKFRGPPPSETDLFEEIEKYLDEKIVQKTRKRRQVQRREIDMMYG